MNDDLENDSEKPPTDDEIINQPSIENPPEIPAGRTWRDLARYVYDCNPFYLVSAALLLFGITRLSTDPAFLGREVYQLIFNFSALEAYEALLVLIALMLSRRSIWYDSTLLVVLDGVFAFVPFVLITQSVLIGQGMAATLAGLGFVLALARFGIFRWRLKLLRFPTGMLTIGLGLLLLNSIAPFLLRHVIENGTDRWIPYDRWGWYVVLPGVCLAANFLPRPKSWGGQAPERSWLPLLIFGLWASATAVHLYCLGYISELPFRLVAVIPSLWVLAWTYSNRLTDFFAAPARGCEVASLIVPATIPLVTVFASVEMVVVLATINAVVYSWRYLSRGTESLSLQLGLASIALVVGGLQELMEFGLVAGSPQSRLIFSAAAAYVLMNGVWTRSPILGLISAIVLAAAICAVGGASFHAIAIQAGAIFLLAHSLRWEEHPASYASALRLFAALFWVVHSFFWMQVGGLLAAWTVIGGAGLLLLGYGVLRFLLRYQVSWVVPVSAAVAALVTPMHLAAEKARNAPNGLIAVVGSFALLIVGTIVALRRSRDNGASR